MCSSISRCAATGPAAGILVAMVSLGFVLASPAAAAPPPPVAAAATPQRLAVPPAAEVQAALAKIQEIFTAEYAGAKSPAGKSQLAAQLLAQAMSDQSPAAGWALMNEAGRLAVAAGDVSLAFKVADQVAENYAINGSKALREIGQGLIATASGQGAKNLAQRISMIADEALAADDNQAAEELSVMLATLSRKSRDAEIVGLSNALRQRLKEHEAFQAEIRPLQVALQTTPDNPQANLELGLMLWTKAGKTEKALPMLAKGADEELAALAASELTASLEPEATALVDRADRWWKWGERQKPELRIAAENMAMASYRRALPSLTGLDKLRVERRLSDTSFAETRPGAAVPLASLVESGLEGSENAFFKDGTWGKNKPFLWQGKEHPTALFYGPKDDSTSVIRYDVPKGAKKLQGVVGVFKRPGMPNFWRPANPVSFSIIGDGKVLWQSPQLKDVDSGALTELDFLYQAI